MKREKLLSLLLCVAMILTLCGCGADKRNIDTTVSEFEYACQNMDLNAMLKCVDPEISDPIRITLSFLGVVTDITIDDLLDQLTKKVFGDKYAPSDFLSQITFTDRKTTTKGKSTVMDCTMNFVIGKDPYSRFTHIHLIKVDKEWYISRIDFSTK